jgi:predicted nicotinamide N-methyase
MLPGTLLTAKTITLTIPYSSEGASCVTCPIEVEQIEQDAAEMRRAACASAAAERCRHPKDVQVTDSRDLSAIDGDWEAADESDPSLCSLSIHLRQPSAAEIAGSIGGKLWDASLLMSSWVLENPSYFPQPRPGRRRPRILELGAGLGLVGLVAARSLRAVAVTLSDYDTAVLLNLAHNIALNFPPGGDNPPETTQIDFRDFWWGVFASQTSSEERGKGVAERDMAFLLGAFDMIVASDVVYSEYHAELATVICCLLRPDPVESAARSSAEPEAAVPGWRPRALLVLPDSRPRLSSFVAGLRAAGLCCRIERVDQRWRMARRLRRQHDGWGADASFSIYHVTRED